MQILLIIVVIWAAIEIRWSPRIDKTIQGDYLLWYYKNRHRVWKKLF